MAIGLASWRKKATFQHKWKRGKGVPGLVPGRIFWQKKQVQGPQWERISAHGNSKDSAHSGEMLMAGKQGVSN